MSANPLKYKPSQIAKAAVAALTSVVALLTLAAAEFAEGPLSVIGGWATAALLVLMPVVVFAKKAEPWMEMLGRLTVDNQPRVEE